MKPRVINGINLRFTSNSQGGLKIFNLSIDNDGNVVTKSGWSVKPVHQVNLLQTNVNYVEYAKDTSKVIARVLNRFNQKTKEEINYAQAYSVKQGFQKFGEKGEKGSFWWNEAISYPRNFWTSDFWWITRKRKRNQQWKTWYSWLKKTATK
jgi:hypothetical protein